MANDLGCQDFARAWVEQLELPQCWNPQIVCAQVEEHTQESKIKFIFALSAKSDNIMYSTMNRLKSLREEHKFVATCVNWRLGADLQVTLLL